MASKTVKANVVDKFDNLLEYRAWVDAQMGRLHDFNRDFPSWFTVEGVQSNIRSVGEKWYGKGVTAQEVVAGITQYKDPALIERLMAKVQDAIPTATSDQVKVRRMDFNDRGMGLFSFDRAAMGLYRLTEFFSPSLGRTVEREECEAVDGKWLLIADGSQVVERLEQHPDGRPKVRTSTKKVFAWFPKRNKEREAVEIYIGCGGNSNLSAEQMLYSGLGAIVFAQMLDKARIPTKVTMVVGSTPDSYETAYLALIPVKKYDQQLDANLLATLSSDPRFYRHDGFRGVVSIYDHFGKECPSTLGSAMTREGIVRCIEQLTYTKDAKLAANRFYFGGTHTEHDAVTQVKLAVQTLAKKLNP